MAQSLPDAQFVGIDLSARQLAEGQAMLDAAGLSNVTLKHMDILDVDADLGPSVGADQGFDYIIAHGIYSWVPPVVQNKILEVSKQLLTPNGVAYISYNTYPGWYLLRALREMMLYHIRDITDPHQQATQARDLLEFLADSEPVGESAHSGFLKAYVSFSRERLLPKTDALLIHDELSEVNEPIYFYQFAEQVARHGLRYLAEAEFQTMLASNLPHDVAGKLREMAQDTITLEQYMDFLRNRTFRQSLLCHDHVQLKGSPHPDLVVNFYVGSPALPMEKEPDVHSREVEKFRAVDEAIFSTDHPLTKAAMVHLTEIWPQCVSFKTLVSNALARLNGARSEVEHDAQVLGANLLKAYSYSDSLVELHVCAPSYVVEAGERPVASPVARLQAQKGSRVTNLRHERIELSGINYHLLPHLDGSRDRAALVEVLERLAAEGRIDLEGEDKPVEEGDGQSVDPGQARPLPDLLDSKLGQLARAALLLS